MAAFPSSPNLNDEHSKGSTRFKWDGAKWKRLGQNFDTTTIAQEVAASIGGGGGDVSSVDGRTGDVLVYEPESKVFTVTYGGSYSNYNIDGVLIPNSTLKLFKGMGYKFDISDSGLTGTYQGGASIRYVTPDMNPWELPVVLTESEKYYTSGTIGTTGAYLYFEPPDDENTYYFYYQYLTGSSYRRNIISIYDLTLNSVNDNLTIPSEVYQEFGMTAAYDGSFPFSMSNIRYSLDGVEKDSPILFRGMRYKFDLSDSSNTNPAGAYNFTIYTDSTGSTEYTSGFSKIGTEGLDGYALFKVPHDAPNTLHYGGKGSAPYGGPSYIPMGATLEIQTITGQ